ncbi:MAG: IS630 family transposase [Lewinellaceae bacterium]|nr:IS630 family transposase [Lewinellaceae bacterium]
MIHLDEATVKRLRFLQRTNKDRRVFIKVTVLLMLHKQFSPQDIADSLGIDDSTVYRYRQAFDALGLDVYLSNAFVAYSGQLSEDQEAVLRKELRSNLYINNREVAQYIHHRFGIRYSLSAVVKLLHRLRFVYKKTKLVPAKANTQAQQAFIQKLEELLAQTDENQVVYFNDAVHPQHNTRADYGWIYQGEDFEMPANPGRKRVNINGALNAQKVTDVVIFETERVNVQSCIELWKKQHRKHPGKTIYNICDNAPYYHSKVLREWFENNPWCQVIQVIYLPPYTPNLNLIERIWSFLRKQVTSYIYYDHFAEFRRAILGF